MDKIFSVLQVVLPVVVMLLVGVLTKKKHLVSDSGIADIKSLLSNVCIPATLFSTFYTAEFTWSAAILVVTMLVFTLVAWFLGFVLQKLLHIRQPMAPYLCTSFEGGMMGFALFILLFGQENLYHLALLDLGNALIVFLVLLTKLRLRSQDTVSIREVAKELVTPINLAIAGGLIVNFSGLGRVLSASGVSAILDGLLSFLSAPAGFLILLVVGYGLDFSHVQWGDTLKTIAARIFIFAVFGIAVYYLISLLTPGEVIAGYGVIMAFILPPTFMYSVFAKGEDEQSYVGSVLALYTLLSLIAYAVLAWLAA